MTIKLFDELFHHHDHFIFTEKNEHHFHEYHEKCPISSFKLSLYSLEKQFRETQKAYYTVELTINYFFVYCCNSSDYSFLLRAPPVLQKVLEYLK